MILMDQSRLDSLAGADIRARTLSDHAPVTAQLDHLHQGAGEWTWRLNENLLDDAIVTRVVTDTISNYFRENGGDEVSPSAVWEGHKAVVRGELISQVARLRRECMADLNRLLAQIREAELSHKKSQSADALQTLQTLREELSELLELQIRRRLRYFSHKFYEFVRADVGPSVT